MSKGPIKLKTRKDYKDAMRRLRGKVSFNYSLRPEVKYSPAQKANLSKAINSLPSADQDSQFFKPRRKPRESQRAYRARVERIKKSVGQEGSPVLGVYAKVGTGARASFVGDKLTIKNPAVNSKYAEEHVGIDKQTLASRPWRNAAFKRQLKAHTKRGFERVHVRVGTNRTRAFDATDPEHFLDQFNKWLAEYDTQKQLSFLGQMEHDAGITGLIFTKGQ